MARKSPIAYFSEVRDGQAVEDFEGERLTSAPEVPAVAAEGSVATQYLVFIDDYFTIGAHRDRVLARLGEQLSGLGPSDRMAVVAFDGRRLEVLTPWTAAKEEIAGFLALAAKRPARGAFERVAQRNLQSGAELPRPFGVGSEVWLPLEAPFGSEQRGYAEWLQALLKAEVGAASAAMRAFSAVAGRKVLLLAGSWPLSPMELAGGSQRVFPERGEIEGRDLYQPLIETANLLGYTLYPVDVAGIQIGAADVEAPAPPAGVAAAGSRFAQDGGAPPGSGPGALAESNFDGTFQRLARETGGRALVNTLRDRALAVAAADTRTYYWLGYVPDRLRDDRPHAIVVEAVREGLRTRSRRSFLDLSRGTEVSALVEGALLLGRPASPHPLPFQLGEIRQRGRKLEVPIVVGIPVDEVTILPVGREFVAELELRVGVVDAMGTLSEITVQPIRLASEKAPRKGGLVRHDTRLTLAREEHEVVLALLDPASGNLLSSHFKVAKP